MIIGVASSIAAAHGFDWHLTTQFASGHDCKAVQLYAGKNLHPPFPDVFPFKHTLIHLPGPEISDGLREQLKSVNRELAPSFWIIHQSGYSPALAKTALPENFSGMLAIENDDPDGQAESFLRCLSSAREGGERFAAVLDVHRFYHDFHSKNTDNEIFTTVEQVIQFCSDNTIQLVLHVIDSKSFSASRTDWCALFDGVIPYREIFDRISQSFKQGSIIIFEYEDAVLAEKSIKRLKSFL